MEVGRGEELSDNEDYVKVCFIDLETTGLDFSSDEITLSLLSIIFFTYSARFVPFLSLEIILALEVAVIAVSDPDKKPDNRIKNIITTSNERLIKLMNYLIR